MTQDEAFLQAVLDHPEDDAVRLIYGDWLMDRGDPRGEFIHVQCRLALLPRDEPQRRSLQRREQELLDRHRTEWERPAGSVGSRPVFSRGFVEGLTLDAEDFLDHAADLFGRTPLRRVSLQSAAGFVEQVAASPFLGRLTDLDVSGNVLTDVDVRYLAHSPHLRNLTRLSLLGTDLTSNGVWVLAGSLYLTRLIELNLQINRIGPDGLRALADSPRLVGLASLNLYHNRTGDDGARAVAGSAMLRRLAFLNLGDNRIHDEGAVALATAPHLEGLTHLRLHDNLIGGTVREQLRRRLGDRVLV